MLRAKKKPSAHQLRDGFRNCSRKCECSRAKAGSAEQCSLCSELNGKRDTDKRIITALRDFRVLTAQELCYQAEFKWPESLARAMKRYVASGRVKVKTEVTAGGDVQALYIWVGDRMTL